ncbi:zf-C3HC4 4 multi-domain protein [Scophthalmus maximus]|uniref:Zf-C3HC4 4 multi-domain protein n=1 Tax=Scophthalmus maximus TaxID=52904 RepID=A0A2U9AZV9_SCOMX|nr:zf-C3HC4 4 multi-domain protein [Scophthalmus maximus]
MASNLSEEQFHCCICLDFFHNPTSIPCGHNFCLKCIQRFWDTRRKSVCPVCKKAFKIRPELTINFGLRDITNGFKGNHNRLQEMFCRTDQMPVCAKCNAKDHKYHNVVPIEQESRTIKTWIKKTEAEVQQMIQGRVRKIEQIKNSVQLSKTQKDKEIQTSVEVFTMVISAIERNQALLIEEIEKKQEATEQRAEEFLRELERENSELQTRSCELQVLENTDDPLYLLQCVPRLSVPLSTRDWSEVQVHSDVYIGTVRRALSKLVETCHDLEKNLSSDAVGRITRYAVDVTLDPATAAGWLILSPDGKKVSLSKMQRKVLLPDEPRRFDACVSVLGKQSFTSGRHFWVVQVGDKTDWDLGVARESINTKGAIMVRPDSGYWAICRRKGGSLSACAGPSVPLPLLETPQRVAIFLDYEDGSVSFYDADTKTHIYTYSGCSFTEPLYPYFNPCLHDNGRNAAPLVICPADGCVEV